MNSNSKTTKKKIDLFGKKSMVIVVIGTMLLSYLIFMIFPICYALVGSFFEWNPMIGTFNFLGLDNYKEAFTSTLMWKSLLNSIYFTVVVVFFRTILGLVFAILVNEVTKFKSFYRTVYYLPVVTSMVAVSLVWKIMYNPAFGIINQMLNAIGLPSLKWLQDSVQAMPAVMLMTIWKDMGYAMVLFLAGLQGIPKQCTEAALIDGSSKIQTYWYITLPLLKNTTFFVVITSVISYLQTFTQIFMLTEGGPGDATYTSVYLLYYEAFTKYRFGYASSISFILFVVILVFSVFQVRANNKAEVSY